MTQSTDARKPDSLEFEHLREYEGIRSQVEAGTLTSEIVEQFPPIRQMQARSIAEACELDVFGWVLDEEAAIEQ